MRLNEILKQNKDFKSNTSLMERKVDELTEENGVLSSQVRTPQSFSLSILRMILSVQFCWNNLISYVCKKSAA